MPPMKSPPPRRRGTKAAAAAALVAGSFLLHGAAAFVPSPAGRSARWVRLRPGAPAELAAPLGYADGSVGPGGGSGPGGAVPPLVAGMDSREQLEAFLRADGFNGGGTGSTGQLRVVKVYASWCRSCRAFDVRYRKLASRWRGQAEVEFADLEFGANEKLCRSNGWTKLPYVLFYRVGGPGEGGRGVGIGDAVEEFICGPSRFEVVEQTLDRLLEASSPPPPGVDVGVEPAFDAVMEQGRSLTEGIVRQLRKQREGNQRER